LDKVGDVGVGVKVAGDEDDLGFVPDADVVVEGVKTTTSELIWSAFGSGTIDFFKKNTSISLEVLAS